MKQHDHIVDDDLASIYPRQHQLHVLVTLRTLQPTQASVAPCSTSGQGQGQSQGQGQGQSQGQGQGQGQGQSEAKQMPNFSNVDPHFS